MAAQKAGNNHSDPSLESINVHIKHIEQGQEKAERQYESDRKRANERLTFLEERMGKMEAAWNGMTEKVVALKEDVVDLKATLQKTQDLASSSADSAKSAHAWIKGNTVAVMVFVPIITSLALFILQYLARNP